MAICFGGNLAVGIIDRTIPELFLIKPNIKKLGTVYLCWLLNSYGVDLFEINSQVIKALKILPLGLQFIFRIESECDMELLDTFHIKKCIVTRKHASEAFLEQLKGKGISIALELSVKTEEDIATAIAKVNGILGYIDVLRICDLERVESFSWMSKIKSTTQGTLIKIDICPSNGLSMATAIALEAALDQADYLSLTFAGIGATSGFAAFEELLLAIRVLKGVDHDVSLKTLPDAVRLINEISDIRISPIKPVIGKNIFMYESGLHADGIQKKAITYELFDPDVVGQKRALIIGKHSGSGSIINKFREMGIACRKDEAEQLLKIVRDLSIYLSRGLSGDEIADLYEVHCKVRSEEMVN